MLYGIIDIGSNTIRMAIYLIEGEHIEMLMKKKHTVGLAAYVHDGVMGRDGIAHTIAVLREYREFLRELGISHVAAFATAALRNARNSREAVAAIECETGLRIRVVTGEEEATFDFVGATHDVAADSGLIVDIGGGSTELVAYSERRIEKKVSLPIGSLLFKSRFQMGILPTSEEQRVMRREARAALAAAADFVGLTEPTLIGLGGTFKGGSALYNALMQKPLGTHSISAEGLRRLIEEFTFEGALTQEKSILLMRAIPDRLTTVLPGLVIAEVVFEAFSSREVIYSDSGVREGFIYSEIVGKT